MSKAIALLILAILLYSTLSYAARPNPSPSPQHDQGARKHHDDDVVGEKCGEGVGEEECLMRRTLIAHLDYIYTQSKTP